MEFTGKIFILMIIIIVCKSPEKALIDMYSQLKIVILNYLVRLKSCAMIATL